MKIVIRRGALPDRRETSLRHQGTSRGKAMAGKSGCRTALRGLQGGGIDGFGAAGDGAEEMTGGE